MTKYLQVTEKAPEGKKQALELWNYAKLLYANNKFEKSTFIKLLKEQKGKDTALKGSVADPALTFNYYLPALLFYGHMNSYIDDEKQTPKLGSIDPFHRVGKKSSGGKSKRGGSLTEELATLEATIEEATKRIADIKDILSKANAAAAAAKEASSDDDGEDLTEDEMKEGTEEDDDAI